MSVYRHATNLKVPLDGIDLGFLSLLTDYRIGAPVPAKHEGARPLEDLRADGYIGLYITADEIETNIDLKKRTGWTTAVLGNELWTLS